MLLYYINKKNVIRNITLGYLRFFPYIKIKKIEKKKDCVGHMKIKL